MTIRNFVAILFVLLLTKVKISHVNLQLQLLNCNYIKNDQKTSHFF